MEADAENRQGEVLYGVDMAFVPYEYEEKKGPDISHGSRSNDRGHISGGTFICGDWREE